jgi:hypothetical protein
MGLHLRQPSRIHPPRIVADTPVVFLLAFVGLLRLWSLAAEEPVELSPKIFRGGTSYALSSLFISGDLCVCSGRHEAGFILVGAFSRSSISPL